MKLIVTVSGEYPYPAFPENFAQAMANNIATLMRAYGLKDVGVLLVDSEGLYSPLEPKP